MKKIIATSCAILVALTLFSQNKYSVPERNCNEQKTRLQWLMQYQMVTSISVGKTMGQSAEETGNAYGKFYVQSWNNEGGFDLFVNACLRNFVDISEKVEIQSQTTNKVVAKVFGISKVLGSNKTLYGVSEKEFIAFLQHSHNLIADYMGANIQLNLKNDGLEVVLSDL